jgi:hypothetical protein
MGKVVLPAGLAPATVWFEASRANLLRYGSVSCDLKVIRPRDTELMLTPSFCRRPAVDSGDGPASRLDTGSGRKLAAPLGIAPRFTISETVVLLLHYRAKSAWPDYPKAIEPRFIATVGSGCGQVGKITGR